MKKRLLLGYMYLLLLAGKTHANILQQYDCPLIQNGVNQSLAEYSKSFNNQRPSIFDEKTLGMALNNLSNYCNGKVGGAESYYIFDHLVDISFRKLDAYPDASLRYNVEADDLGLRWQKLVTDYANPSKNTTPEQIIAGFTTYRPLSEVAGTRFNTTNTCDIPNIDILSLMGRYRAACEIALCISEKRGRVTQLLSSENSISKIATTPEICQNIVENRYMRESSYIRQLVARSGVRTINTILQQYTQNYFIGTRWQNLFEQFTKFDQELSFVNRKVQEGTPVCSAK